MKRATIMIAMLGTAIWGSAQGGFAQSTDKPAMQSAPATQTAAPAGKRLPQAKTQPEYDAYKAAVALTDPAAQEKAAADFATKFPESELRPLLYKAVMGAYQQSNADKMIEMAQNILTYDADDPDGLLGVAQGLAEQTRDPVLDRDQRMAEARKDAQRALITVDTDVPTAGVAPEKLNAYKSFVRSQAYYILGTIDYNNKAWPDAEADLRKSIDAYPQSVDAVAVLKLSLALDQQNKYPEALKYANQAVDLTKEGTNAGDAARKEKDRLTQLTGGAPTVK